MVPDLRKLGFELMAFTFVKFTKGLNEEELAKVRKVGPEFQERNPTAVLMGLNGMGLGYDRLLVSLHENHSSFLKVIKLIKEIPNVDIADIESFVVSLTEKHYQPLTLSVIAKYLSEMKESSAL